MSTSGEQIASALSPDVAQTNLSAADDPLIGTLFAGKYEVESLLGRGGMSSVYAAQNKLIKHRVAIKLLQSHLARNSNAVLRFKQEAIAINQLNHKNIIGIQHFDVTEGEDSAPYIVMDLLDGKSLSDIIESEGALSVQRVLKIFLQACSALDHAHSRGVIHRDLKPSNLMLVKEDGLLDVVKIVDFGIAKMLPTEGEELLHLTQTGEIFGSPLYMSPEQCMGQKMDARSDVYSMGCILYEALAAEPPFRGGNVFETISKHISELPTPLAVRFPHLPQVKALDNVILRAMAKDPTHRYQSMLEMMEDLDAIYKGRGKSLPSAIAQKWHSFIIKVAPSVKRVPPKVLATIVVSVAIVAGGASWLGQLYSISPTLAAHDWGNYPGPAHTESPEVYRQTEIKVKQLLTVLRSRSASLSATPEKELELRNRAATWFMSKGLYNDALVEYDRITKHLGSAVDALPLPNKGDLALHAGDCFYENRDYKAAMKWYEIALECWSITVDYNGDDGVFSEANIKLADAYDRLGRTNAAYDILTRGRDRSRSIQHYGPLNRALLYSKLGDIQFKLGQFADAEKSYGDALKQWEGINRPYEVARVRLSQGLAAEKQQHYARAEKMFSEAAAELKRQRKIPEYAAGISAKSRVQSAQGNLLGAALSDLEARSAWKSNVN